MMHFLELLIWASAMFLWTYWAFYSIRLFAIYWLRLISLIHLAHKTSFKIYETEGELFQVFYKHLSRTYWFKDLDFSYPNSNDELSLPTDLKTCFWFFNKFRKFFFLNSTYLRVMFVTVVGSFILSFLHATVIIGVLALAWMTANSYAVTGVFWSYIGYNVCYTISKIVSFFDGYQKHDS